jgi:hypothetical protein
MVRTWFVTGVILCGVSGAAIGCGGGSPSTESASSAPADAASTATPAPAAAASAPEPKTIADLFPAAPEKEVVMNSCGSCHNVACSVIGQRPDDRWNSLRDSHTDRVSGIDVDAVFAYLKTNFGQSKPEPKVPPAFLEGGCTPF